MSDIRLIALLTDSSSRDTFVGCMKGVIARKKPALSTINTTHEISSGDIRQAAVSLWIAQPYIPRNSFFFCVVDPGVGNAHKGLLIKTGACFFIGPDNGLSSNIMTPPARIWELRKPTLALSDPSKTFHGRDICAAAAVFLACGISVSEFSPEVQDLLKLPYPCQYSPEPEILLGEILYADKLGNLITSLGKFRGLNPGYLLHEPWVPAMEQTRYQNHHLRFRLPIKVVFLWVDRYAEVPFGQGAVLSGSGGLSEIVAGNQSAETILELKAGDAVIMETYGGNNGKICH